MIESVWERLVAHRPGDDLAHPLHLVDAREVHQDREAREQLKPLGEGAEHRERLGDVLLGVGAELPHEVVLVLHLPVAEEGLVLGLRHADRVEEMRIGGDVDGLHIGERRQHHLHLGRLEHAGIVPHVAVVHLDVGLG